MTENAKNAKNKAKKKNDKKSISKTDMLFAFLWQRKVLISVLLLLIILSVLLIFLFSRKKEPEKIDIQDYMTESLSLLTEAPETDENYLDLLEESFSYSVDGIEKDEDGNYFAVISYSAKDVVSSYDDYLNTHGNDLIKSKEQMDEIFSEIVSNSESVKGTIRLPIDYEDGEYIISDMSDLIDIMYGHLLSHITELHDNEVESNTESKGE